MKNKLIINQFKKIICEILNDLSTKHIDRLEENGRIGRLNKREVIKTLKNFNCQTVELPEDEFLNLQPIEIETKDSLKLWHLDIDLWCNGEPSDLTLSLSLQENSEGVLNAKILDLHVL